MPQNHSRVRAWQPTSPVSWVYLILFVVGAVLWPAVFSGGVAVGYWIAAIAWVVVLGMLLALLIRWLDLFRGNQKSLLVAAFLWGAVPAASFALRINQALVADFDRHLVGYQAWDAAAVAPVVEETLKAVGVVLIVLVGRRYIVRAAQAAGIGAMSGLGFQLIEDINYALHGAAGELSSQGIVGGTAGVVDVTVTRTLFSASSHWTFSALVGLGIGYALVRRDRSTARRIAMVATLYVAAVGMHFVFDSPTPEEPAVALALSVGKAVGIVLVSCVIYVLAMRAEWRRFAAVAGAEPADVISPDDVAALRSHRGRRKARRRAREESGRSAALLLQLQHAQLQLVNDVLRDGDAPQQRSDVRQLRTRAHPTGQTSSA